MPGSARAHCKHCRAVRSALLAHKDKSLTAVVRSASLAHKDKSLTAVVRSASLAHTASRSSSRTGNSPGAFLHTVSLPWRAPRYRNMSNSCKTSSPRSEATPAKRDASRPKCRARPALPKYVELVQTSSPRSEATPAKRDASRPKCLSIAGHCRCVFFLHISENSVCFFRLSML